MTDTKEKESVGSEARLEKVVAKLYINGNDLRNEKNASGGKAKLISKVSATPHIVTCGLYSCVGLTYRKYINDKSARTIGDLKMNQDLIGFILTKEKEAAPGHYVRISDKGRELMQEILDANEWTSRFKKLFKICTIFPFQERQKVTPKEAG